MKRARHNLLRRVSCLLLFLLVCSGCMMVGKPPMPWYEVYRVLPDPDAEVFVQQSLEQAQSEFGLPVVPVNTILLRRSRKAEVARRYPVAQDFTLTECADPTNGLFVIYVGEDPRHKNYYPLLGHETVHLLNPFIFDWYMEGVATVFSEQACAKAGRAWGDWKHTFSRGKRDPYALSYQMMSELRRACPEKYPTIVRFAVPVKDHPKRQRIDIDAWLASLSSGQRTHAEEIIFTYAKKLEKHALNGYSFTVPKAVK